MTVQVSFQQSIELKFTLGNSTAIFNETKLTKLTLCADPKMPRPTMASLYLQCRDCHSKSIRFGPLQRLRCCWGRHRRRFGRARPWRRRVTPNHGDITSTMLPFKYRCSLFLVYSLPRFLVYPDLLLTLVIYQRFGITVVAEDDLPTVDVQTYDIITLIYCTHKYANSHLTSTKPQ